MNELLPHGFALTGYLENNKIKIVVKYIMARTTKGLFIYLSLTKGIETIIPALILNHIIDL